MEKTIENVWTKSKLLIKALIIGAIVLVLQIPTYYIHNLIEEREVRQKEATAEVSSKWAGKQNITGPVLVLPYWEAAGDTSYTKSKNKQFAYFLPDELNITADVSPQEKYRGIYKVMLYSARIKMFGAFSPMLHEKLRIPASDIIWNEAFVKLHLSDVKGLNEQMNITWNGTMLPLTNTSEADTLVEESLYVTLPLTNESSLSNMNFSTSFSINGSEQLLFTPVGKSTAVTIRSGWPHPSFTGNTLPQTTQVKDSGFIANWKSLSHKRKFTQQWKGNTYDVYKSSATHLMTANLANAAFGANLFIPVNGYQKTMRSVKYAALCILLTFAAFFILETTNKRSVHPFQYGLIGIALVLFYILLLSFSEYIGFNLSYAIASLLTIGLIGWFAKGLLGSSKLTMMLAIILVLLYTYVFTILQLQDYSLILGSLGLFLTLAVIMYFSKKAQW